MTEYQYLQRGEPSNKKFLKASPIIHFILNENLLFQKRNPLLKLGLCMRASLWLFVVAQVKTGEEDVVLLEDPPSF